MFGKKKTPQASDESETASQTSESPVSRQESASSDSIKDLISHRLDVETQLAGNLFKKC